MARRLNHFKIIGHNLLIRQVLRRRDRLRHGLSQQPDKKNADSPFRNVTGEPASRPTASPTPRQPGRVSGVVIHAAPRLSRDRLRARSMIVMPMRQQNRSNRVHRLPHGREQRPDVLTRRIHPRIDEHHSAPRSHRIRAIQIRRPPQTPDRITQREDLTAEQDKPHSLSDRWI